jgi:hypothetical protein
MVFKKTATIFSPKLAKIADNSYHNIVFQEKREYFRRKLAKIELITGESCFTTARLFSGDRNAISLKRKFSQGPI